MFNKWQLDPKYVKFEVIKLDVIRIGINTIIKKNIPFIYELKIREAAKEIKIQLEGFLAGKQEHRKEIILKTPKTWKDHFKQKYRFHWIMKKWIKKHPIQYKEHKIDIRKYLVFPEFRIPQEVKGQQEIRWREIIKT